MRRIDKSDIVEVNKILNSLAPILKNKSSDMVITAIVIILSRVPDIDDGYSLDSILEFVSKTFEDKQNKVIS